MINIIVAIDKNYLIGNRNKIPWNIPEDLKLFKEKTTDNFLLMGRKTFESIGKPLPNRVNIVISKSLNSDFKIEENKIYKFEDLLNKIIVFSNIEDGLEFYKKINFKNNYDKDIYIIGGGSIYNEFIQKKNFHKLCISHIDGDFLGDTYFPKINFKDYKIILEKKFNNFIYREYI
ncbi:MULTISPECIES: dihydrofolate reductase [Fusobacterium]|uniref:dihydrofolate reductase n=1 Tax=Fusobacterium TaxID=848 RepID=UPI001476A7AA|nr:MULTISPECIES: dihydrofolate reductase [Fusobacterium]NME35286.1 dihydrofolate reductase [Fusobacterium sp. FSA-380-WT-3A]